MSVEKITNRLKTGKEVPVPQDLLEKIVDSIPEEIELHPEISGRAPKPLLHRRRALLAVAAAAGIALTASVSWEVYRNSVGRMEQSIVAEKAATPSAPKQEHDDQASPQLTEPPKLKENPTEIPSETEEPADGNRSTPERAVGKTAKANKSQMRIAPPKPLQAEEGDTQELLPRTIQVIDPDGGLLPGVAINVESPEKQTVETAITDAKGKATVILPRTGDYTASVGIPGFVTQQVKLPEPGQEEASETKVRLSPAPFTSETVSITAESPVIETKEFSSHAMRTPDTGKGRRFRKYAPAPEKRSRVHDGPTDSLVPGCPNPGSPPIPPSTGGEAEPNSQAYGDVFFSSEGVNPFIDTEDDALSTFGLDVDTASFTVTRRYLEDGHLPPPDAVRVEEFLNSFDYGDPPPRHGDFRIVMEGAPSAFAPGQGYETLRINLKAREVDAADRPPAVLVFCVDISGSMARENRLGLVRKALLELLDHLRSDDRVGVVVYGSQGRVLLTPTHDHGKIEAAIRGLEPGGSTNAEEGLLLAYRSLDDYADGERDGRILRVILCSDGVANTGRTGADGILDRIRRERGRGIELTTVGFGMGNYNDVLMERLADAGDGRYVYVDSLKEARKIFVEELTGNLMTIARDAKAQVEFDPKIVSRWRLIGYENRDIEDNRFRDPTVDAGEIGAGHSVTALYQIKLNPGISRRDTVAVFRLRYRPRNSENVVELEEKLLVRDLASKWRKASPALKLASQVGAFAELLRRSYWSRGISFEEILDKLDEIKNVPCKAPQFQQLRKMLIRAAGIQPEEKVAEIN